MGLVASAEAGDNDTRRRIAGVYIVLATLILAILNHQQIHYSNVI